MRRNGHIDLLNTSQTLGQIRADYDAARNTRFKRKRVGIAPMGSGADYHYRNPRAYYETMELARDIFRNNMVVGQGIRRLAANVVQQGFSFDPDSGSEDLDKSLSARWSDWSDNPDACDTSMEETFTGMTVQAMTSMVVDGDIFGLLSDKGAVSLVEGHRAKTPTGTTRNVVLGILLDELRRRKEVWITKENLEPARTIARVSEIDPYSIRDADGNRQVLQIFWPDRVSQTRGVTAFQPAIATADHGDDLAFAQLLKAQMAACYVILRQLKEGAPPQAPGQHGERTEETRPDGSIRTIEGIGPAMEVFGYPGESITGFSPNVPNAEYFQHAMLILTIVAINLDLPLQILLLDAKQTNFSGWRGAMDQAKFRFRQFQQRLTVRWHRPVVQWKIRQWLAEDRGLRQMAQAAGVNIFKHRWHPPTWPYIEPLKDASADLLRTRNAQASHSRICSERGMDWEAESTAIVRDNALLIRKAMAATDEITKEFPQHKVDWHEVATLPTPDGISIKLAADGGQEPEGAVDAA